MGKHELLPFTHLAIPDSGYYEHWVFRPRDKGIANGFLHINTFLYSIGVQSFLIYNSILLLLSIYCCSIFKCISSQAVSLARAVIVFNPYLLISVLGPTKEINLTFYSLFSLFLFSKDTLILKFLSIIPALIALSIRPQFGLIILVSLATVVVLNFARKTIWFCLLIFVSFLLLNSIPAINSIISNSGGEELEFFASSNYYEVAMILKFMQESPILQIPALIIKMILVMFAPIARPNNIFSEYIPLLDWGYTIMGWVLFPINMGFILLFIYQSVANYPRINRMAQLILIYAFLGVFSTIIAPIIQARYLYPYAPFLAACFTLHSIKVRNRIFILSATLIVLMFVITAVFLPKKWNSLIDTPQLFISWL
ncbi:hypothetical protein [Dyadobacter jejuensis]|nr:hypothetical protein [Dyadobacter jejuensis]